MLLKPIKTWNTKGKTGKVNVIFEVLMGKTQEKISGTRGQKMSFGAPEKKEEYRCGNDTI